MVDLMGKEVSNGSSFRCGTRAQQPRGACTHDRGRRRTTTTRRRHRQKTIETTQTRHNDRIFWLLPHAPVGRVDERLDELDVDVAEVIKEEGVDHADELAKDNDTKSSLLVVKWGRGSRVRVFFVCVSGRLSLLRQTRRSRSFRDDEI